MSPEILLPECCGEAFLYSTYSFPLDESTSLYLRFRYIYFVLPGGMEDSSVLLWVESVCGKWECETQSGHNVGKHGGRRGAGFWLYM